MSGRWSLSNFSLTSTESTKELPPPSDAKQNARDPDDSEKEAATHKNALADLLSGFEARKENMASSPNSPNKPQLSQSQSLPLLSPRSLLSLEAKKEGIESKPLEAKESKPIVPPLATHLLENGASLVTPRAHTTASESKGLTPVPEARILDVSSLSTPRSATPARSAGPIAVSSPMEIDAVLRGTAPILPAEVDSDKDIDRLIRWEQQTQQVDREQSEIMQQQQRLFREQVSTLSGEALQMRHEIKELQRLLQQERSERSVAIGKFREDLEAERWARSNARSELQQELEQLRNSTEEGFRTSATYMKEQFEITEKLVRDNEASLQQSMAHLESQLGEEVKARIAGDGQQENLCQQASEALQQMIRKVEGQLEEKFSCLRTNLTELASVTEVVKNNIELESKERTKSDKELLADLQVLKKNLDQEMANRLKGDESCLDFLKQSLDSEVRERDELRRVTEALSKTLSQEFTALLETRMVTAEALIQQAGRDMQSQVETEAKARAAADRELDEKCAQLRTALAETANDAAFSALKKDLEREVAERKMGSQSMQQLFSDLQSRSATKADVEAIQKGLDMEMTERGKIDTALQEQFSEKFSQLRPFLEAASTKDDLQALKKSLDNEIAERMNIGTMLQEQFAKMGAMLSEAATKAELQAVKNFCEGESAERAKGDKTLEEHFFQALKLALDNEMKERVNGDKSLEDKILQFRPILAEFATKVEIQAVTTKVEGDLRCLKDLEELKLALDNEMKERMSSHKGIEDKLLQLQPILTEFATKAEMQIVTTKVDDLRPILEGFATKAEMQTVTTKVDDIRPILEGFATKAEMQNVTTKVDDLRPILEGFATKTEVQTVTTKVDDNSQCLKAVDEKFMQLRPLLADFAAKADISSLRGEFEDKFVQLRPILADTAGKADLVELEDKFSQLRNIFSEFAKQSDLSLLREDLRKEVNERVEGDENIMNAMKQDHESIMSECGDKLNGVTRRQSQLEDELIERIKLIIESVQHEKQQRLTEVKQLESALQNIPVDVITQQLKDIWAGVESEAMQRKTADEALDRSLRSDLENISRKLLDQDAEWQRSMKRMLDEQSFLYKEEIANTASALSTLQSKVDDERSNRTRTLADIVDKVVKHEEQFGVLVRDQATRGDSTSQQVQELTRSLEREKTARMEEHADLRRGYESSASDLERSLHTHKLDIEQQLVRSLETCVKEWNDRHAAMDKKLTVELERAVDQHNSNLSDMKDKLVTLSRHIDVKAPLF